MSAAEAAFSPPTRRGLGFLIRKRLSLKTLDRWNGHLKSQPEQQDNRSISIWNGLERWNGQDRPVTRTGGASYGES